MTAPETLAERLARLQAAYAVTEDHTLAERDAREAYFEALADAYEGGELITRAEVARLVAEAVEKEREGCAQRALGDADECERMAKKADAQGHDSAADQDRQAAQIARGIAAAIRARAAQTEKEG